MRGVCIRRSWPFLLLLVLMAPASFGQANIAWVKTFGGGGGQVPSIDYPYEAALGPGGTFYQTGHCSRAGSPSWAATVKYWPDGTVAWSREYVDPEGLTTFGYGLAIDNADNAYVLCRRFNTTGEYSILLLKYSVAGDLLWQYYYRDPLTLDDVAYDLAFDSDGNVWVCGNSLAVDQTYSLIILKLTADGEFIWQRSYRLEGGLSTTGKAIIANGTGTVDIVANPATILRFDLDGDTIWTCPITTPDGYSSCQIYYLAGDPLGNAIACGTAYSPETRDDWLVAKVDASGALVWERLYVGQGTSIQTQRDTPAGLRTDQSGNVYASGEVGSPIARTDALVIKYSPDGDLLWSRLFNSRLDPYDGADGLAVDADGNVYATGYSEKFASADILSMKCAADGSVAWVRRYHGDPGHVDYGDEIFIDASGAVLVSGYIFTAAGLADYVAIKYVAGPYSWGDANGDGAVNIGDAVALMNYIFKGIPPADPVENGDANCDGAINVSDVVYFINHVFKGGFPPDCL